MPAMVICPRLHLRGIVMYLCGFHLRIQKDVQALYYVVDRHILNSSPVRNQKPVFRASLSFRVSAISVPFLGRCESPLTKLWIACPRTRQRLDSVGFRVVATNRSQSRFRKMRLLEHWLCRATVELQKRSRKQQDGKTSYPPAKAELRIGNYSRSRPNSKADALSCSAIHD